MDYLRTIEVADALNTNSERLMALIRRRRIKPAPPRDGLGHFRWAKEDIDRARKVIKEIEATRDRYVK
jgi:hypothetical protein